MGSGIRMLPGGLFSGFAGRGVDTGVSVLAIVLRFTIWVLAIVAIVWIVREIVATVQGGRTRRVNPAVAELDMLYARGDVNRTEYLARRADLAGIAPPAPPVA
jgi:uncharacterized membrane protein